MAKVMTDESNYTAIAGAIRTKLGVSTRYKPSEMASAIESIHGSSISIPNFKAGGSTSYPLEKVGVKLGPFRSGSSFITPTDDYGNDIFPKWNQPFEICVTFEITSLDSGGHALFGSKSGYYSTPSIEVRPQNNNFWCGWSTNGSTWTESMQIEGSDGLSLQTGTQIIVDAVYDGTEYTVTVDDGTSLVSKSMSVSGAHYYSNSRLLQFGGINVDSSHYAKCEIIDLSNTYIKENGVLLWGLEK